MKPYPAIEALQRPLRVVTVCNSDLRGGAAIVSYRLMEALREHGVEATMLVSNRLSENQFVSPISGGLTYRWHFLAERAKIFAHNGLNRDNLFKVSTASTGSMIHNIKAVKDADVVILNWINQGTMSLKGIERLLATGKPAIWVMHDMWCITGICHHALDCTNYTKECGNCMFLGKAASADDLSHRVWAKKQNIYGREPRLQFVAVSRWLKERAMQSSLLKGRDVRVIANAFPTEQFAVDAPYTPAIEALRGYYRVIVLGAARLDDPIKGLDYAIDALNIIADRQPAETKNAVAVFFGDIRHPEALERLRFPHLHIGAVTDRATLAGLYAHSDVVLSASLYETLGSTLVEGMSAGAVPVSFGRGGQTDVIDHLHNGYLADYLNATDLAEGILWALRSGPRREMQHQYATDNFGQQKIVSKILSLINEMLTNQ